MSKPKVIILVGCPCSGKSTWSKEYVKEHTKTLRFNRDDVRIMLNNLPYLDAIGEYIVTTMLDEGMKAASTIGRDIIIDQTNCRLSYIEKFIKNFGDTCDIKFKIFTEDLGTLLKRNYERAIATGISKIPEEIMLRYYANQKILCSSEEFLKILKEYEQLK